MSRPRFEPVYSPVIALALSSFKAMGWDVTVTGAEHLPRTGGGVIATNHVSYLDFIVVGAGVRTADRRKLRFLAKQEVFDHPLAGPLMRSMRHIPVDRDRGGGHAFDAARRALVAGELIGMFPESTISRSFVPLPGKSGSSRLAIDTGAPLIPGAVWGSQRLWTKDRPRHVRRGITITVAFGPAIATTPGDDPAAVTAKLMDAIGDLVADAQESYPQRPSGEHDTWWLPAHLGGSAPTPEQARSMADQERQSRRDRRAHGGR